MISHVFKFLINPFLNNDNLEFENTDNLTECPCCFEEKTLVTFCSNNHNICYKCCNEWLDKSLFCPICRNPCNNNTISKYNFVLKNVNYENIERFNIKGYFKSWHKQRCIQRKHNFCIFLTKDKKNLIIQCKTCNIEQRF